MMPNAFFVFMYHANSLDVLGINYNHEKFEQLPTLWPGKKIIASETTSGLASRGQYDMPSDSIRYWPARGERTVSKGNADLTVHAGGRDLAFITVEITDARGNPAPHAGNQITFEISGAATIPGTDNGYQASTGPFKGNLRNVYKGKCLVILQSSRTAGDIRLTAKSGELVPATIALKSR